MAPPRGSADQAFLVWMEEEQQRREVVRLRQRLRRLEWLQLLSYFMIWFWTAAMFCGYRTRPTLVPAEMAGVVTAMAFFGGALVVWHIIRLKRELQARLETLMADGVPEGHERMES